MQFVVWIETVIAGKSVAVHRAGHLESGDVRQLRINHTCSALRRSGVGYQVKVPQPRRPPQLPSPVAGGKSLTWQWRDDG